MSITQRKFNTGYTLIELSLIILLIGVILVFGLPKLDNLGDTKLRTTARQLTGKIQSLYDESVLKKKPYQIVFDITNRKREYTLATAPLTGKVKISEGYEAAMSNE